MVNNMNIIKAIDNQMFCPEATQDISMNLANRKICVDKANYGPANPDLPNDDFWQQKADLFKTSVEQSKTMRCKNCAAFIQTDKMMNCIQKGIAEVSEEDQELEIAKDIVDAANLGYCELFDFKCAGERTCDAWITGGPIT
jgi:hypothetical protein